MTTIVSRETVCRVLGVAGAVCAALGLVACGPGVHTREGGVVGTVAVTPVAWNPTRADVGTVRAVADTGKVVAVFADDRATVLSSGAVVASDRSVTGWIDAQTIPGADGAARWIVGVDGRGRLYYLHGLSSFEDVSSRYGLDGRAVHGAAVLGPSLVAFLLDQELALADGHRVTRFGSPALAQLVGGGGWGAGVSTDAVFVFGAAKHDARQYPLEGVTQAAVGHDGRLYASTSRAVYAAAPGGDLALAYDAGGDTIHGLVASGDHVWFADGAELGVVDGDRVAVTRGAKLAPAAKLAASPSGDVWVLSGGTLQRFARTVPEQALAAAWTTTLAPIFARACASCHQADGVSGTDLSSAEAWHSERTTIHDRIVVTHTMPPPGHPLSDDDRAAIQAWTEGAAN
jgi:mono/diheme cytochrome c family protein